MICDKSSISFQPLPEHHRFPDLSAQVFHSWRVLGYAGHYAWFCECQCGIVRAVSGSSLCGGGSRSCGCRGKPNPNIVLPRGYSRLPEYQVFYEVKKRCENPKTKAFADYGGRGIQCRFKSFAEFFTHIGSRPSPQMSIERIDNESHYEPGNVKWATPTQQANNRRSCRLITFRGKTQDTVQWDFEMGYAYGTVKGRLHRGWCESCAISIPTIRKTYNACKHHVSSNSLN